jgi:iron only hydrogenase large subunit-like protein
MACKGGCIGGAGQPRCEDKDVLELRRKGLFANDEQMEVRMSHKNTYVQKVYDEFLERPYSEKAKLLLHLER